ncbi:pyridoxamine 5'-phosphate oxidase family protein [Streptomyces fuscigenes]|uniref:pyridoxamine 5'-phosphate oxidase family protein n=1 Tax=Streptomyces fuscigenes TaxID=1528880 RepID=UPI001F195550|nr:pyridoxamine 5'-phosphate oxidase family protein [Streptomyces fuscigenes]MCF3964785.1 pyridoxamine 5'-phosphate oxidase family protein [Streptomyces fuscigenes]
MPEADTAADPRPTDPARTDPARTDPARTDPARTDPVPAGYRPTDRTVPTRSRERARYDRELVHRLLDASYLCHLGFVRDGAPVVLPTLYGRIGESLYVHGSTGSRPLRAAGERAGAGAGPGGEGAGPGEEPGLPVCLTVTQVDGLVLARSAFHHSVNYHSVVVHGVARQVTDEAERRTALDAIVDHILPGRAEDSRRANAKELAATAVVRLDLDEVSAKVRTGGPNDEPEDADLPHWTGVVPVARTYGTPLPADDLDPAVALPDYLARLAP